MSCQSHQKSSLYDISNMFTDYDTVTCMGITESEEEGMRDPPVPFLSVERDYKLIAIYCHNCPSLLIGGAILRHHLWMKFSD